MITVVFSPHTDDAIFSIGAHLATLENVLIASPMAGLPDDQQGKQKHSRLRDEHETACGIVGSTWRNGNFLDDCYPPPDRGNLHHWLKGFVELADTVYIPVGIHHPDHMLVSELLLDMVESPAFYEELPYRVNYPQLTKSRLTELGKRCAPLALTEVEPTEAKRAAVLAYRSQVTIPCTDMVDDALIAKLMVTERLWS